MTVGKKLLCVCRVLPLAVTLLIGVAPLGAEVFVEGDLHRQAALGFRVSPGEHGLAVNGLIADSPAAQAGVRDGDLLVAVNGKQFERPYAGEAMLEKLKGGDRTTLTLSRDNRELQVAFTPASRPFEAIEGVDSYYGVVETPDGARLRTIITKPSAVAGKLPALLFTQWVSCGTIEYREGSTSRGILAQLARRSGMALVRVERTTSGDSEGPACHELDYDTEVAHYVHAFDELLRRSPHLDRDRIVVRGSSLGSTTAPLVALALQQRGHGIDGVAVGGGGAVTYFERMLWFDRWYLERRPQEVDVRTIHDEILRRIRFHYEYLINGRSPDDVAGDSAEMASVRRDIRGLGDGVHYGRPYAYHQQAANKNFLAAWAEVDAAVLVVYGEFDQFEQRHGHKMIVDVVNRLRPGTARYVELKNTDHGYWVYPNEVDAYADVKGVAAPELLIDPVLEWLKNHVGISPLASSR
jgi:hypothetical protein